MKQDAGTALKRGRVIQWARVAFFRNASTTKSHFRRYFSSKRRSSMLSWHPAHLEGITAVGGGAYGSTTGSRCPFLDLFGRPFFFGVDAGPSTAGGISPDAIELWDVDADARCTPATRLLMKSSSLNESSSPKFCRGSIMGPGSSFTALSPGHVPSMNSTLIASTTSCFTSTFSNSATGAISFEGGPVEESLGFRRMGGRSMGHGGALYVALSLACHPDMKKLLV